MFQRVLIRNVLKRSDCNLRRFFPSRFNPVNCATRTRYLHREAIFSSYIGFVLDECFQDGVKVPVLVYL